jgi:hypothetical protein
MERYTEYIAPKDHDPGAGEGAGAPRHGSRARFREGRREFEMWLGKDGGQEIVCCPPEERERSWPVVKSGH